MKFCNSGALMLVTTAGAFIAFSLMTIAVGTDYWLYSPGVCRSKTSIHDNETIHKNEEVMTHSGLWRTCCLEGVFRGVCKEIDHFLEDADYEQDAAEYLLRAVRASSLFPILSVFLLFLGGVCVAASEFHKSKHNVILSAGILFVSAGLSNIIGIIVYISANSGDPGQSDSKKSYSYGWSFYFGAMSFVLAEMVGVLTVHVFIERHRRLRTSGRPSLTKPSLVHSASYYNRYNRYRRRSSYRGNMDTRYSLSTAGQPQPHDSSSAALSMSKVVAAGPAGSEFTLYTLAPPKLPPPNSKTADAGSGVEVGRSNFLSPLMAMPDNKETLPSNTNRRTTPV
ncbi:voltage-dependent calcium channel gamma-3 subunit-like isoform X2 [Esox lucius]|uniref:Voltage-dependent calcium channel gamma-3 subunit n=1 Tax=Esox lucius TaxID=8010 RepID=A0AAY5KX94_ESOLU|nr:voltage-dependent calcium channel gamma-3 subunit-like isoform X2 [Esox lucius]